MNVERDPRNPGSGGMLLCPEAMVLIVRDTNFVVKQTGSPEQEFLPSLRLLIR